MSQSKTSSNIKFVLRRGCLALQGSYINTIGSAWTKACQNDRFQRASKTRYTRDGESHHVTVISASEMKSIDVSLTELNKSLSSSDIVDLGIGSCNEITFFVILFAPRLQRIRINLGLPFLDFHITLGFIDSDVYNVRKCIETLWFNDNDQKFYNTIERILRGKASAEVRTFSNYNRLAELAMQKGYLFGSYYLAKYQSHTNARKAYDILETAASCDPEAHSCLQCSEGEMDYGEQVCKALNYNIYTKPAYHRLRRYYSSTVQKNAKNQYMYHVTSRNFPRNFSFVSDRVCGSSIPDDRKYFEILCAIGITDVVSLLEEPLSTEHYKELPIKCHFFNLIDRTPPSTNQMKQIMEIFDNKEKKVLVHCIGGVGRTATALAAHLMWTQNLSREQAKAPLLEYRKTIISRSQDEFLSTWFRVCCNRQLVTQNVSISVKFPPLILCVGYPCSGKSTFSQALCRSKDKAVFTRINQDEQGRKDCEQRIGASVKVEGSTTILDRCNLTVSERQEWLKISQSPMAWAIHFTTPEEECKWRIVRRQGHPTVKHGRGARIIDTLAGTLEPPTKREGFTRVFQVHGFEDANALLREWGCTRMPVSTIPEEVGLIKFPRTRHAQNLGSATRDDLIMSNDEVDRSFLNRPVCVEEKIDGANMGLSIRSNKIVAQNRSHFVTSAYHPQFKLLDKWIHEMSAALWDILETDRYVLYGEWLYATHSIHYSRLSDWFVAFDMYDCFENRFWSRDRLEACLDGSGISMVPRIALTSLSKPSDLRDLVNTKSAFYDGPVEGVVLRLFDEDNLWLRIRGKIVRSDFLSGNKHWSKYSLTPNKREIT